VHEPDEVVVVEPQLVGSPMSNRRDHASQRTRIGGIAVAEVQNAADAAHG
jgi:hypothetical protein